MQLISKRMVHLCLIIGLVVLAYSNIFGNHFVGDDQEFILQWETIRNVNSIPTLLGGDVPVGHEGVYRPVRSLVYLGMYQLFGSEVFWYHVYSLLVHLIAVVCIYFIVINLGLNQFVAGVSTLVFGLHPVHVESITYITSSFDAFGFMVFFGSMLAYLMYLQTKARLTLLISYILAVIAYFSEELTLSLPLLLTVIHLTLPQFQPLSKYWKHVLPYYGLAILYGLIRVMVDTSARGYYLDGSIYLTLLVRIKALFYYVGLVVFPVRLTLDHTIPPGLPSFTHPELIAPLARSQRWFDPSLLLSAVGLSGIIGWALRIRKVFAYVSLGILWFFISLLPVINLLPSYTLVREMYLYIPSFGFSLMFGIVAYQLYLRKRLTVVMVAVVIVGLGIRLYMRNGDWRNEESLWQSTVGHSPNNPLVYYKLGSAYQRVGKAQEALAAYQSAINLDAALPFVYYNRGVLYEQLGDADQALAEYKQAVSYGGSEEIYTTAYDTLLYQQSIQTGVDLAETHQYDQAQRHFETAVTLVPCPDTAYENLGTLFALQRKFTLAREYFEKALECNPHSTTVPEYLKQL